jgi:hypothetical protein
MASVRRLLGNVKIEEFSKISDSTYSFSSDGTMWYSVEFKSWNSLLNVGTFLRLLRDAIRIRISLPVCLILVNMKKRLSGKEKRGFCQLRQTLVRSIFYAYTCSPGMQRTITWKRAQSLFWENSCIFWHTVKTNIKTSLGTSKAYTKRGLMKFTNY